MPARVRALLAEPLLHFVVLGALLFGVDAWRTRATPETDEPEAAEASFAAPTGPIVVDAGVRESLAQHWGQTHADPPTDDQMRDLVAGWVDEEVLYREGLARGLAEGDAEVRRRVASQMAYVLRSRLTAGEPTEAELRAWYEAHPDRWATSDRIDFTQVFVAGLDDAAQARARELLALLQDGADPNGLGDTFAGGRRFRGRRPDDLAARFGDAFVEGLAEQAEGTWTLRPSTEGLHLVRVDRRAAASTPAFEAVREAVEHDLREAEEARAFDDAVAALRERWEVVQPE